EPAHGTQERLSSALPERCDRTSRGGDSGALAGVSRRDRHIRRKARARCRGRERGAGHRTWRGRGRLARTQDERHRPDHPPPCALRDAPRRGRAGRGRHGRGDGARQGLLRRRGAPVRRRRPAGGERGRSRGCGGGLWRGPGPAGQVWI
ncbi:MAG: Transcription termination protein NusB, partial [uncultured Rubrobacteraceae bacterium]